MADRLLVVDDEPSMREFLEILLSRKAPSGKRPLPERKLKILERSNRTSYSPMSKCPA